jgi:hypothetical protein
MQFDIQLMVVISSCHLEQIEAPCEAPMIELSPGRIKSFPIEHSVQL